MYKRQAYIFADGKLQSVPVEHSNTRWSKPVGRGRSEVCQLASSATCFGAVAQTKGIRCSHPSSMKGTAAIALNGELRGHAPGGDGRPPDGGTGTMFQVTVTKPRRPPATSAALRAVGRFWELTPPRLRRAGIPIHLAEGQSNAREQQVRGALNGLTPSASHCTRTLQAVQ